MNKDLNKYRHIAPIVADVMRRMFDPTIEIKKLLENKKFLESFAELILAMEIISVCNGKKPGNEFVKLFRNSIKDKHMSSKRFLMHLATLFYFDSNRKLFKSVIENQKIEKLSSAQIISLTTRAIWNESFASEDRLDSDSVKVKGGTKKAIIVSNEKEVSSADEPDSFIEEASISVEDAFKAIFKTQDKENLSKVILKHVQESYRSDRARNMSLYVDYIITSGGKKKPKTTQAALDLGISRKALHQIQKTLKEDAQFKSLLKAYLKNNQ